MQGFEGKLLRGNLQDMCLHGRNLFRAVHRLTDDFGIGQEVAFPKPPAAVLVQSTARICQHDDGGKGLIDNRDFFS